jgi:hypothetical protein
MGEHFSVYIDESGDDGFGKFRSTGQPGQSHWLTLGAVIVTPETDRELVTWRDAVMASLGRTRKRTLHFADLNHEQRVGTCALLSDKQFGVICCLANKVALHESPTGHSLRAKNQLYKYQLRLLLERVSQACRRKCQGLGRSAIPARLVFSRRGGMDYDDFIAYMQHLRLVQQEGGSRYPVDWNFLDLDATEVRSHNELAGLQIADCVASAFQKAVEPDMFGNTENRYARILEPRVIRSRNGLKLNFGVKPFPHLSSMSLIEDQRAFFDWWDKKWQAPAP